MIFQLIPIERNDNNAVSSTIGILNPSTPTKYCILKCLIQSIWTVYGEVETENQIGVVTGLAWTEFGGEILKIESVVMPGKGKMQITGKLGDVMQESVKAAKSYVRSKSLEFGIIPPTFDKKDFHIHVF